MFRVSVLLNFDDDFDNGVCYVLSRLGLSHLKLRNEQKQSISAVYDGNDVFVYYPTGRW